MGLRKALICVGILAVVALVAATGAAAQEGKQQQQVTWEDVGYWSQRIINVDAATILPDDMTYLGAEARFLLDDDDNEYYSVQLKHVPVDWLSLEAVGTFASEESITTPYTTLCYGGDSIELRAKARLYEDADVCFSIMPGVEFSDTPAQDTEHMTLQLMLTHYATPDIQAHLTPKFAFLDHNTVMGVGLGAEFRVHPQVRLLADVTPIVVGDNTRNEMGCLDDSIIWGFGVRVNPDLASDDWLVDVTVGTGKGQTTSYELTPGIFDSLGVSVGACHVW